MVAKFFAVMVVAVALDAGPAACRGCGDGLPLQEPNDMDTAHPDTDTDTDDDTGTDVDTDADTDTDPLTDAGIDGGPSDAGSKSNRSNLSRSSVGVLIQYYESLRK